MTGRSAFAFATGCVLGGGFYTAAQALLSGQAQQIVPIAGAIAVSSLFPMLLVKSQARSNAKKVNLSLSQRLDVLKAHALVNIVDEQSRVVEVNDKLLDLTGYTRADLIGKPVTMLYDEAGKKLAAEIRNNLARGKTWQGETPLMRADGSIFYTHTTVMPLFDTKGHWVGSISARTDVTHVNKLMSERSTASTLHELNDDVWIVDAESQSFSYMNRAAMRRFGVSSEIYTQKTLTDFAADYGLAPIKIACDALVESDGAFAQLECDMDAKTFQVTIKHLHDYDEAGRLLIMLEDISRRVEQERLEANFISTVSHELRSPMTSIKGSMGLLLSNAAGNLPKSARGLIEIAHRNADRLVLIINDILDLDKISSGQMDFDIKRINISELVQESISASATLNQRFAMNIECVGTEIPHWIDTDPNRIMQILTNLLSNASKFSKSNGRITLSLEAKGQDLRVSVRDEGAGIPAKDQPKVFQRFADMANSERSVKGGTGLGLSICKAIVENLGGSIGFDSVEGVGTTFFFTLPKANAKAHQLEEMVQFREVG